MAMPVPMIEKHSHLDNAITVSVEQYGIMRHKEAGNWPIFRAVDTHHTPYNSRSPNTSCVLQVNQPPISEHNRQWIEFRITEIRTDKNGVDREHVHIFTLPDDVADVFREYMANRAIK